MAKYGLKSFANDVARFGLIVAMPFFNLKRHFDGSKAELKQLLKIKGKAIIVANHTGFSDPIVLDLLFWRRRVRFLAAKEVMHSKLLEILLKGAGCISIDRDIFDFASIKKCMEVLDEGKMLIMFPGGRIEAEAKAYKSGVALMAARTAAPILPVYIAPKEQGVKGKHLVLGRPIDPVEICGKMPSKAKLDELAAYIKTKEDELERQYNELWHK